MLAKDASAWGSARPTSLGLPGPASAISLNFTGCAAIKNDGTVWCWGPVSEGEPGDASGAESSTPTPTQIPGLE